MKKRFVIFVLVIAILCTMLPQVSIQAEAATHKVVMTSSEFIECLKIALSRKNVYNNVYPYNLGYYNGSTISWDCWNLGKSIIWTKGTIVNNYTVGNHARVDTSCGLGDWDGLTIVQQAPNCSSDFSNLVPGEWLYLNGHTGYYIGDGQVIECTTSWGANGITQSQIDNNGNRSRNGVSGGKWLYHGMVPWIDYSNPNENITSPLVKKEYPAYCAIKISDTITYVKSLPCSQKTDPNSKSLESATEGTQYQAIGLYENSAGNLWYKVKTKSGTMGYIYAGDTTFVEQLKDDLTVSGVAAPTDLKEGSAFSIKGIIAAQYQTLSKVGAWVNNSSGAFVTGGTEDVNTSSYNLNASSVDNAVRFNDLGAGKYTYYIGATIKTYYASSATTVSSRQMTVDLYESAFSVVADTSCSHSYKTSVTSPTCTAKGYTTYTCKSCGYSYTGNNTDALGHSYGNWVTTSAASCTANGTKKSTCSRCGDTKTETIAATGHSYGSWITETAANCTADGVQKSTCANCGNVKTQAIPATGHAYGGWVTDKAATCITEGIQKSTCAYCGHAKTQAITAPGHNYVSETIDSTCVDVAQTRYTCTNCGDFYVEYHSDAYTEWSTTKPVGVDESLIESRTEYRYQTKEFTTGTNSAMDGWTLYDTTSQGSDYGPWSDWSDTPASANDATRVESRTVYGYYYFLCPNCGAHMHGYGNCYTWAGGCGIKTYNDGWVEIWSTTTWNDAGLKDWHGTGKYYTYIDGELVFKWPEGGSKTQYRTSTRTQETIYEFYRWSEWSGWSATPASANENQNIETRIVYRYVNAELGSHNYTSTVTASTCTERGYTTYTCTACGDSYVGDYVDTRGHSFVNGVCTNCNEKDSNAILWGDANGDGIVNNIDAMQILQYAVGLKNESDLVFAVCDVNGDGAVNNIDAMQILQFAVGLITEFAAAK